ncbi:hypothetical protein LZ198_04420 [Myxococcus sp. K15C18031901]|uniref:hypothetical protein n=1 Tax=Myxococcus dinghuensis TaxID=2906761 RepID=UPI0020A6F374|nr:hypothetical protein [Myxococcus dinghuensis]MCP3098120.1 hypothetical protein [Myxococcus dinghuensis]
MSGPSRDDKNLPDDATVERLRAAVRGEEPLEGGAPVDADLVWRAVSGELPPEERRAVVARVAADPAWATAWRLAHELSRAAQEVPKTETPAPGARSRRSERPAREARRFRFAWSHPAWGSVAVAALVLVVLGITLRPEVEPRLRGMDGREVTSLLPDDMALPREAFILRWSGGPDGTLWSLQLSSEDLGVTHRVETQQRAEYQVPASVLAPLPAGAKVLWQVEARLPDGRVRRSATFVNRLE